MKQPRSTPRLALSSTSLSRRASAGTPAVLAAAMASALLGASSALLGGCGGGGPDRQSASGFTPGTLHENPDPNADSLRFVVDANQGGQSTGLRLTTVYWGRLVDVEDLDGTPVAHDLVVGSALGTTSDRVFFSNPITERTTVSIRHELGTPAFDMAFSDLASDAHLVLVSDAGLNPVLTIPFVPRNGALLVQFNDLLDPTTVNNLNLRVQTGYPPETPFLARIIPDPNHGDLADRDSVEGLEYYPTRIVVDSTVSNAEAQGTNLLVNALGFPASVTLGQANIQLRIPTRTSVEFGQSELLRNLAGRPTSTNGSGTYDADSETREVVRSMRSGGPDELTSDPSNGFLPDTSSPSVLGTQPVVFDSLIEAVPGETGLFKTNLFYAFQPCASQLRVGDVLQQTVGGCTVYGEVVCPPGNVCPPDQAATGDVVGALLNNVFFRYVPTSDEACAEAGFQSGAVAQVGIRFSAAVHDGREACFLTFSNIGLPPDKDVAPDSTISVRFTEPMDPASLRAFDTFFVANSETSRNYNNFVVARVSASPDLRTFTFRPSLPFRHQGPVGPTPGTAESYWTELRLQTSTQDGVLDLAGNPLQDAFSQVKFDIARNAATALTRGIVFRFDSDDMFPGENATPTNGAGFPEFRGQFLTDGLLQIVRPRPVSRFQAAADRTQAVPSNMQAFPGGVQTPISKYGSKLQTLWRYCDVGFGLTDEQFYNVDVEHLYLSPASGQVIADNIPRFEISLAHSRFLPDESVDPVGLLPVWPSSGLVSTYAQNLLNATSDPQTLVHPGLHGIPGFVIQPINASVTNTGTTVLPMPLNFNIPTDRFTYWTWRDTAKLAVGGASGPGAELQIVTVVTGTGTQGQPYAAGAVPTVGLPILMEFRCYPDSDVSGQNAWDISLATASSAQPNFRAFGTGGFPVGNQTVPTTVNPDTQAVASGGFNPTSTPQPGAATLAADNSFYIGALDLVVRVNRMHSVWIDSLVTNGIGVRYQEPLLEPDPSEQPSGTQIQLAFRGASVVPTGADNVNMRFNADALNAYGNPSTGTAATYFPTPSNNGWVNTLASLNSPTPTTSGATFFQTRITFVSNAATNLSPTLSALAYAWRQ